MRVHRIADENGLYRCADYELPQTHGSGLVTV
jgi:hypothetical protein